jgi:hypothetical protein
MAEDEDEPLMPSGIYEEEMVVLATCTATPGTLSDEEAVSFLFQNVSFLQSSHTLT